MSAPERMLNYIDGVWSDAAGAELLDVHDPATGEMLARVPLSAPGEIDRAARAAAAAQRAWKRTPAPARIQFLFKLKALLEEHFEELAGTITTENGKTLEEARGEMRRAVENVEVACGIPTMMMGDYSEDIAPGVDEYMIRQPVGVAAMICPFNFPGMIPFWYLPYALACGNAAIVKPSERTPITMQKVFRLLDQAGFPKGVVNLVNGGRDAVNSILDHPGIQAVTFVGSTPVARHVYARAAANGKRVQAQGGAKNPVIILPDADPATTTSIVMDSAFGNAGQRCLAASLAVTVGEAGRIFRPLFAEAAAARVVGCGREPGVQMGPVISPESKERIRQLIEAGLREGAEIVVDGRDVTVPRYERGNFLRPTILDRIPRGGTIATTEIFGPVLGMTHVDTLEEAIGLASISTVLEWANVRLETGRQAKRINRFLLPNQGIGVGVSASPEATK
ncbi:MAG: aldehyde dehydrogenase family protein [Acidobacteria bacterium]|nr:aldehyde dehydrogenase family protein [Acidobacteriota bacterium]